jgi:hypothetical protein
VRAANARARVPPAPVRGQREREKEREKKKKTEKIIMIIFFSVFFFLSLSRLCAVSVACARVCVNVAGRAQSFPRRRGMALAPPTLFSTVEKNRKKK